jgi:hypothetical protein
MTDPRDRHDHGQPNHPGYDRTPSKQEVKQTIWERERQEARQNRDKLNKENQEVYDDSDDGVWFDSDYEK